MAGEGAPGQRDHCIFRPAAMPAFRRVPPRASGGIQRQAPALDRPGRRERGGRSRGHPPLPVRGPALPGASYSPRAAGCPDHHPRRRPRPFPRPRRPADTCSRRLGDRHPGGTVPVHSQRPPAVLRCCVRGPRTVPGRSPGRTVTVIRQAPMRRSQVAFIRRAWMVVRRIVAPVAWKTASKERVKIDPPSRIRNLMSSNRSPRRIARLRACCTVQSPVGCAVTPPRCIRRVPCSMNTSTYSLFSSTVSTCRKSTARIPAAWAVRNCRQAGPARRGAGSMPAARRIS